MINVYALSHPISNEIRYIGVTKYDLKKRLNSHFNDTRKTHKTNWINSLKRDGLKPIIELLSIVRPEDCEIEERVLNITNIVRSAKHNRTSGGFKWQYDFQPNTQK